MRAFAAALALLFFAAAPAAAEERILRFVSDVAVQADSSLEVTETIDVHSEGERIRHGIFRDFPTLYKGRHGGRVRVGFDFEGAELDGHTESAKVEPLSNGVRIRVGSADTELPAGDHRFVIHYRTTRQIGRFPDYDELYWNATGNGWVFPIDVAEARIRLPSSASFGQRAVYTGPEGSTEHNAQVISEEPGEIAFQTTWPLGPHEGLTVAVAWPKGVIAQPDEGAKLGWWLADYGPPALGALGLMGLLAFYYIAWQRAGRDPRAGTIVPAFSPPDDLSPAGMRYIREMSADNRAFAAALVEMGVRGHVRISETEGGWFSGDKRSIERMESTTPLPEAERAALAELVPINGTIAMEKENHEKFSAAKEALEEVLSDKYDGKLFKRNYAWAAAGLALFVAALWLVAAAIAFATGFASGSAIAVAIGAAITALLLLVLQEQLLRGAKVLLIALAVLFGLGALIVGAPLFLAALTTGWLFPLIVPALALPLVFSAFWWMSAPTIEGRRVLDHIAGFKQYLSITERERLDRMTPPEDTPELFEKYLPYAIALGVENRWADRFAPVLAAAAAAQGAHGFLWYSGSGSPWSDPGDFVDSVGSSLATSVSSASTAPGSSSGSGGGGFSGGGGGGGGGGGW